MADQKDVRHLPSPLRVDFGHPESKNTILNQFRMKNSFFTLFFREDSESLQISEISRTFRSRTNRAKRFMPFGVQKKGLILRDFHEKLKKNSHGKVHLLHISCSLCCSIFPKMTLFQIQKNKIDFFYFYRFSRFSFSRIIPFFESEFVRGN